MMIVLYQGCSNYFLEEVKVVFKKVEKPNFKLESQA